MSVTPADPDPQEPPSAAPKQPQAWDWDAPPPPAPRRSRPQRVPVAGIVVLVVLVCCVFGAFGVLALGGRVEHELRGDRPFVLPTATHAVDLRQYMMPAPAGSHPWRTASADQDLDLDAVAADDGNPAADSVVLREHDFQRAFARRWVSADGTIVEVRLLRFGSFVEAGDYLRLAAAADVGNWGQASQVYGISTGRAFVKAAADAHGYTESMSMAAAGDMNVVVLALQPPPMTATAGVTNAILSTEYALLPQ